MINSSRTPKREGTLEGRGMVGKVEAIINSPRMLISEPLEESFAYRHSRE